MKKIIPLIFLAFLIGCGTMTTEFDNEGFYHLEKSHYNEDGELVVEKTVEPLPARLDPRFLSLEHKITSYGNDYFFKMKNLFLQVFKDDPEAPIGIRYLSANLSGDCMVSIGITFYDPNGCQASYTLVIEMTKNNRRAVIAKTATGRSGLSIYQASKEAMEKTLLALHRAIAIGEESIFLKP